MLTVKTWRTFKNGVVYLLHTDDGYPIETTDTFLPFYTKDAIGRKQNCLTDNDLGSREERWMVGVSTMSGCPVRCKFCATAKLKKWRCLTADEIASQVSFVCRRHIGDYDPLWSKEFKVNYTRMGEPFLNLENVRQAIKQITQVLPNTHHYISTIGIQGSDFSWIKGNITLQISLHSLDEERRRWLIPFPKLMSLEELGQIRTGSNLKTTLNMTLVDEKDFDIEKLKRYFDPKYFFVKLSPINPNDVSRANKLGNGIIEGKNVV